MLLDNDNESNEADLVQNYSICSMKHVTLVLIKYYHS